MLYVLANTIYKYIQYIDYPPFVSCLDAFFFFFGNTEATVRQAKLASTRQSYAFALMKGDGSVVSHLVSKKYMKNDGSMYGCFQK